MSMTDPVADMLTRVRNACQAGHRRVDMPVSKLKVEIARILKNEGYVSNFKVTEDGKQGVLRVYLKYGPGMERVITDVQRVSRPGCRIYCGKDRIPRVYGGLGINILSTSRGLMTGRAAAKEGVGGEIICNVW
jgi:small subunit ribosomal protein S8